MKQTIESENINRTSMNDEIFKKNTTLTDKVDIKPIFDATSLGSKKFKEKYKLKYAYLSGSMLRGISSIDMVIKMGKAGMMGFFGTGGMDLSEIEKAILSIRKELSDEEPFGMNLLYDLHNRTFEENMIDLYLKHNVRVVEASAYLLVTPALVRYHAKGLTRDNTGKIIVKNKIIAKISRPEVAKAFLSPASSQIIDNLLTEKKITKEEAALSKEISVADDICIESDSGGHTDGAVAIVLLPAMIKLKDQLVEKYQYSHDICIGAAGGLGTSEAMAAVFIMGADFVTTGSINQCTVEAGTSDEVKDLLQEMDVQDTTYAPAGDMFELGSKVQVLKKGVFFPSRANKLYDLYRQYNSLDEIDKKTRSQIEEKYFKRSFDSIYEDCKIYHNKINSNEIEKAEKNPKNKMGLIFKWYFYNSTMLALNGNKESKVDYQINCGPALGAFNQCVKGTSLENWRNRKVAEIAIKLLNETAEILINRLNAIIKNYDGHNGI